MKIKYCIPSRSASKRLCYSTNTQRALEILSQRSLETNGVHKNGERKSGKTFYDGYDPKLSTIPAESGTFIDPKEIPVIEVDSDRVHCLGVKGVRAEDGTITSEPILDPRLGHPVDFIRPRWGRISRCKYCGVRYTRSKPEVPDM